MLIDCLIILISMMFSAFFSGMEIAYITSNKLIIEMEKSKGLFTAKIISKFTQNPGKYIATMLVGNNISLVIYGITMERFLDPAIHLVTSSETGKLVIQTIVSTIIILIAGEFLPKALFRNNANSALNIFAVPVRFFDFIFTPISYFSIWLSNVVLRTFMGIRTSQQKNRVAFGKIDIDKFLDDHRNEPSTNDDLKHEIKIFQNALDFSNIKLRACIIPRTEIVALDVNSNIDELRQKFVESGFSKILIYKESIDNIIGYVHSLELFSHPKTIESKLNQVLIVPETMQAHKLLRLFIREHRSIAVVVDEFGGTSGMVTIEDIMEEIFGDIEDEHDKIEFEEQQINEKEFIFSGRLEIDYLNEKYSLNLPESEEYETLAGLIFTFHGNVPNVNEVIKIENYTFKIKKATSTRIEVLHLILGK